MLGLWKTFSYRIDIHTFHNTHIHRRNCSVNSIIVFTHQQFHNWALFVVLIPILVVAFIPWCICSIWLDSTEQYEPIFGVFWKHNDVTCLVNMVQPEYMCVSVRMRIVHIFFFNWSHHNCKWFAFISSR